jgi:hypothetical protein
MRGAHDLAAVLTRLVALPFVVAGLLLTSFGAALVFGAATAVRWVVGEDRK